MCVQPCCLMARITACLLPCLLCAVGIYVLNHHPFYEASVLGISVSNTDTTFLTIASLAFMGSDKSLSFYLLK